MMVAFEQARARPIVLCDVDGTLAFEAQASLTALNARFGTHYLVAQQTAYPRSSAFPTDQGAWLKAMRETTTTFWLNLAPDKDALNALAALRRSGVEVVVASNRPAVMKQTTASWLGQHGVDYDQLLVGDGVKAAFAAAHSGVVAFDDDPRKALELPPLGVTLWMPRRPWTPSWCSLSKTVHVFTDWAEPLASLGVHA